MQQKREKIVPPLYGKDHRPATKYTPAGAEYASKVSQSVVPTVVSQPVQAPKPDSTELDLKNLDPTLLYLADPVFHKLVDYFGLDTREADREKNKLSAIIDWARKNAKSQSAADILSLIKNLDRIIDPGFSERRYAAFYRYIMLAGQKKMIDKEMKIWEKENHGAQGKSR